ncbi:hypothetical protein V8F33_009748 [Rhypophila sp. PSN 637]
MAPCQEVCRLCKSLALYLALVAVDILVKIYSSAAMGNKASTWGITKLIYMVSGSQDHHCDTHKVVSQPCFHPYPKRTHAEEELRIEIVAANEINKAYPSLCRQAHNSQQITPLIISVYCFTNVTYLGIFHTISTMDQALYLFEPPWSNPNQPDRYSVPPACGYFGQEKYDHSMLYIPLLKRIQRLPCMFTPPACMFNRLSS